MLTVRSPRPQEMLIQGVCPGAQESAFSQAVQGGVEQSSEVSLLLWPHQGVCVCGEGGGRGSYKVGVPP